MHILLNRLTLKVQSMFVFIAVLTPWFCAFVNSCPRQGLLRSNNRRNMWYVY